MCVCVLPVKTEKSVCALDHRMSHVDVLDANTVITEIDLVWTQVRDIVSFVLDSAQSLADAFQRGDSATTTGMLRRTLCALTRSGPVLEQLVQTVLGHAARLAHVPTHESTIMVHSMQRAHADIVLRMGAVGSSLLYFVCIQTNEAECLDMASTLLQSGLGNIDYRPEARDGVTALYVAAMAGNHRLVELLLSHRVALELTSTWREETALIVASRLGHMAVVVMLLRGRAMVNCERGSDRASPLIIASAYGHEAIVEVLIDARANVSHVTFPVMDPTQSSASTASALHFAAQNGHTVIVNRLISSGADTEQPTGGTGETALMFAAALGHLHLVQELIQLGANPEARALDGAKALLYASLNGQSAVVQVLTEARSDPNFVSKDGSTCLFIACARAHFAVAEALIQAKADLYATDRRTGMTPLEVASAEGHTALVGLLLLAGRADRDVTADKDILDKGGSDESGTPALFVACLRGHYEVVEMLLGAGANANCTHPSNSSTALMAAAVGLGQGHGKIVETLLAARASVGQQRTSDGATALILAAARGRDGAVKSLLRAQADVGQVTYAAGASALHFAAQSGHRMVVVRLILARAQLDLKTIDDGATALSLAAFHGRRDVVDALVRARANVHSRGRNGDTALFRAADAGHLQVVHCLLSARCSPDTVLDDGTSGLGVAAFRGHLGVIHALLEACAVVNVPSYERGVTPLMVAADEGHSEVVLALVHAGALLESQTIDDGFTALYGAVDRLQVETVRILLNARASPNCPRTLDGATPLVVASESGSVALVRMLLRSRANVNHVTSDDEGGVTALMAASVRGHAEVVELLLSEGNAAFDERLLMDVYPVCNSVLTRVLWFSFPGPGRYIPPGVVDHLEYGPFRELANDVNLYLKREYALVMYGLSVVYQLPEISLCESIHRFMQTSRQEALAIAHVARYGVLPYTEEEYTEEDSSDWEDLD